MYYKKYLNKGERSEKNDKNIQIKIVCKFIELTLWDFFLFLRGLIRGGKLGIWKYN
jgi:hypothetical protein